MQGDVAGAAARAEGALAGVLACMSMAALKPPPLPPPCEQAGRPSELAQPQRSKACSECMHAPATRACHHYLTSAYIGRGGGGPVHRPRSRPHALGGSPCGTDDAHARAQTARARKMNGRRWPGLAAAAAGGRMREEPVRAADLAWRSSTPTRGERARASGGGRWRSCCGEKSRGLDDGPQHHVHRIADVVDGRRGARAAADFTYGSGST